MLHVESLGYTYPGAAAPTVSDVSLQARDGECLCITGPSGCGKTTVLLALKGLLHGGALRGDIEVAVRGERAGLLRPDVGLVFQSAESQILCSTVGEEVAFGPENLCVPPCEIRQRIRRALQDVRLTGFANRNVERLSAGQKHRLAIASVLSMRPRVLLLDEPASQLDAPGKSQLAAVLAHLKALGYSLVIVEHDLEAFRAVVDRYLVMRDGRIVGEYEQIPPAYRGAPSPSMPGGGSRPAAADGGDAPFLQAEDLHLSYPGVGGVLRGVRLAVKRGERIHLHGQNGSGKSSLLACLTGAVDPDSGSIRVGGRAVGGRTRLFGTVGYLLQNPQRQLFENTVEDEVAFSLKRLRLGDAAVRRQVTDALEVCEAGDLAARFPLSLSFGEQHRVALASVIAPRPAVLLLDEPFSGLDREQKLRLLAILGRLNEDENTTVVIASHDPLPAPGWPDRVLTLEEGALA